MKRLIKRKMKSIKELRDKNTKDFQMFLDRFANLVGMLNDTQVKFLGSVKFKDFLKCEQSFLEYFLNDFTIENFSFSINKLNKYEYLLFFYYHNEHGEGIKIANENAIRILIKEEDNVRLIFSEINDIEKLIGFRLGV